MQSFSGGYPIPLPDQWGPCQRRHSKASLPLARGGEATALDCGRTCNGGIIVAAKYGPGRGRLSSSRSVAAGCRRVESSLGTRADDVIEWGQRRIPHKAPHWRSSLCFGTARLLVWWGPMEESSPLDRPTSTAQWPTISFSRRSLASPPPLIGVATGSWGQTAASSRSGMWASTGRSPGLGLFPSTLPFCPG